VGFDKPMLHVPTGEVILGGEDAQSIDSGSGVAQVVVPVTVTPDLVAGWDTNAPTTNQRIKISVELPGYPTGTRYLDIHPDDPPVIDYDQLQPYATPGGQIVQRAAVSSVAGLAGDVTATDLLIALSTARGPGQGIRLVSPNGTAFLLRVSDAGTLSVDPL